MTKESMDKKLFLILKTSILGIILGIVMLFFFALITYFIKINSKTFSLFIYLILVISIFSSSLICASKAESKGYFYGLINAFFMIVVMFLVNILFNKNFIFIDFLIKTSLYLPVGFIGGMIGVNLKKDKKKTYKLKYKSK